MAIILRIFILVIVFIFLIYAHDINPRKLMNLIFKFIHLLFVLFKYIKIDKYYIHLKIKLKTTFHIVTEN